jgi:hypothetical protein
MVKVLPYTYYSFNVLKTKSNRFQHWKDLEQGKFASAIEDTQPCNLGSTFIDLLPFESFNNTLPYIKQV